jgi:LPS sulfotransferase NodH
MIYWILTTPRSGSNYIAAELWRRLGGTPKPMEYFNGEAVATRTDFTPRPDAPIASYLEHLKAHDAHGGVLCVKMLWIQMDACLRYADFLPALAGGRIILLHRRDVIRQAISRYIAEQTNRWVADADNPVTPNVPYNFPAITVDVARMELHNALLRRFLLTHELEHLPVCYEEFAADPEAECERIFTFLGLAPDATAPVAPQPFVRQATSLNEEFYRCYLADERSRFHTGGPKGLVLVSGDGTYRGPPLFPV